MTITECNHQIEISRAIDDLAGEPDDQQIRDWLQRSLQALEHPGAEVSVRIVGTAEVSALNEQYRDQPAPTNVLSFPAGIESEAHRVLLGDIVICNQIVRDESDAYDKPFTSRYAHMLVHGLLHLLGHDHIEETQRLPMEALEIELLSKLDLENPYE